MAEPLKNVYTKQYIENLAIKIKENYEEFDTHNFINSIFDDSWESLELKARMRHIAINLNNHLPLSYEKQLEILKIVSKDFYSFEAMFFQGKISHRFLDFPYNNQAAPLFFLC